MYKYIKHPFNTPFICPYGRTSASKNALPCGQCHHHLGVAVPPAGLALHSELIICSHA